MRASRHNKENLGSSFQGQGQPLESNTKKEPDYDAEEFTPNPWDNAAEIDDGQDGSLSA